MKKDNNEKEELLNSMFGEKEEYKDNQVSDKDSIKDNKNYLFSTDDIEGKEQENKEVRKYKEKKSKMLGRHEDKTLKDVLNPYSNGVFSKRGILFTISLISLTLTLVIIFMTSSNTKANQNILNSKDNRLQIYESTKDWVVEDIRKVLTIKDQETYDKAKQEVHMNQSAKEEVFKDSFNYTTILGAKSAQMLDAQYTLKNKGEDFFKVYLLAKVTLEDDKYRLVNIVTKVQNNIIVDVTIY